jgi:hypothetical protein
VFVGLDQSLGAEIVGFRKDDLSKIRRFQRQIMKPSFEHSVVLGWKNSFDM